MSGVTRFSVVHQDAFERHARLLLLAGRLWESSFVESYGRAPVLVTVWLADSLAA
jgi:hypothetical protein